MKVKRSFALALSAIGVLFIVSVCILLFSGSVGLKYQSNGDGTCIVSGIGAVSDEEIVIPTVSPTGERVIGIGSSAFENCDSIKTVKLHSGIISIGQDAFYDCDSLVYTIYDNAYYIGNEDNPYLILVKVFSTAIESCEIHPDTEIIYGSAFSGCSELRAISVPQDVRSIGSYAFAWCDMLDEIEMSDSVRHIGDYAFLGCKSLGEIKLPPMLKNIGDWTFAWCESLESIKSLGNSQLKEIGSYAFYSCTSLESIDLSKFNKLKSIGYAAFAGCSSMSSVIAPKKAVTVGELAFLGCRTDNENVIPNRAKTKEKIQHVKDLPQNIGVLNTILKAKQLQNVSFVAERTIPQQTGDLEANKLHVGIPYSSTRIENLFVPNFVSLYSFITSTKNPNSYLYAVDIGELGNVNGDTFYGAVCSTYCNYALGIEGMYTTHQWQSIPGMYVLDDHSVNTLKLGDTIVGEGHVLIVTEITRKSSGAVNDITLMDIWITGVRERKFTGDHFTQAYAIDEYTFCRYEKIGESDYTTTRFAAVYDATPKTFNYNLDIIPRRGDKANWLMGTDVEIDVINSLAYEKAEIYKDDILIETRELSDTLILSDLEAGSYKARLVGDGHSSDYCYWIVVDATSTARATGEEGEVSVTFCATNAKPSFIIWQSAEAIGAKHIQFLTDEETDLGRAIGKYISGDYKVRVAFETEYGVIFSNLPEAIEIP